MQTKHPEQDYDPLVKETFDTAHLEYARLRAQCPVAHSEALGGFWALTRYADVQRVFSDPAMFITSVQNVVPKVAFSGRRPPLHFDPPEHTPYRSALNPLLSEQKIAALEPTIRSCIRAELAPLLARGHGDVCGDFASIFQVKVFSIWMNLPAALEAQLAEAGPAFVKAVESADPDKMKETSFVLYDMARALVAMRKAEPMDPALDPVSSFLAVRHEGAPLPEEMVVGAIRQVLVVGIVAPMIMIGNMVIHLARHKDLQAQLRADPTLIPAAVEEFLRLYTPYRGFARTARADVEIGGRLIRKDEAIALIMASANRDEEVFPEPDRFILDRPNIREHLAFGRGPHYCAGTALARKELQIALDELLKATRDWDIDGEVLMSPFPELGPWYVPARFEVAA
ncbi:cytochrome P450 [Massilia niastensis]|uniref:cytochrome P450 n=1 Tax=Massilia niastensis TaxID=544911 RepID=UPI000369071A|nr:cytochrome P450 [Massilia niastensis]